MQPKNRFTSIGAFTLAVLATLVAIAGLATTPAAAETTALCTADESPCTGAHIATHLHETSVSKSKLLTTLGTVECDVLFLGDAVEGTSAPQAFKGNFTYSSCKRSAEGCTTTEENGPRELKLLREGSETASATGEVLFFVKCGSFISCKYIAEGLKGTAKGPLTSTQENGDVTLTGQKVKKESGLLCPKEAELDTLTTTPLTATSIVNGSQPTEPKQEETYGGENPSDPNDPQCPAGDPINCASGNLSEEQTDVPALGGRGPALGVTRSYNAQLAASQSESGPFGYGWTGPYSASLSFDEKAKTATVRQDNGSSATFSEKEGKYVAPEWNLSSLKASGENWIFTLPSQEQLEFNKSGQLTKETDRHKNAITLTYKEGRLETVTSSAGRTLTFGFAEGHVTSVKDPLGHEVKYAYESGNLAKVTLPSATEPTWTFKYDGSHRLTEMTDGRGNTTKNEYDSSNRVTLQTQPLERKRKLEYKETGGVRETVITEPNGSTTIEKFNAMGEPMEVTKASGTAIAQTTKYEYNATFEQVKATDANGHVTKYGYDAEGNKTSEADANGNESKWAYNSTHDVTSETTPKGEMTTITRNASGDPETVKRPAPEAKTQETKFKYAANGDLEEETDPLGQTTKYAYDAYGDKESETDPEGDKRTWGYDADGRVTSEVSPRGYEAGKTPSDYETKTKRDAQERPELITDPTGGKTKYAYDAFGNLKELTNANEHTTTYAYDADNERTEVKAANGDTTKTAYDSEGNVESTTDGNNHTTKYEHNSLNELTKTTDPLGRETTRTYDAAGNLEKLKDPESRTTTYTYDPGNRLTEVKYSEEATKPVTYKYGKDGEVTEMKDGTGTTKKTYDELDRLTEVENGAKEVVTYRYNLGNEITEIVYPNSSAVTRSFDKAGRLEKVTDWLGHETKFSYNLDSALTSTTFPVASEDKDEYAYDKADRIESTTMKKGATTLASITYARDSAGQIKSATQTGLPGAEKPEYKYDERERLKEGAGTEFGYDAANNPTKLGATTQKFDEASELSEAGTTKYAYDKLGERTEAKPEKGTVTKYAYDQAGNLISVTKEGSIEDTYAYDGNGLRSSQKISGTKSQLTWDVSGQLPLLLYDGANYYIYGPDGLPFEQVVGETVTYLHHDHLGSTRLLTNSAGEAKGKYTYTPYGAVQEHEGTSSTPLGFNGQYRNESTGLIYLRARVYDPATAQFLSVDPLVAKTGEAYSYVRDNPVNGGDPSGLCGGPNSWECAFAKASVYAAQIALGASLAALVAAAHLAAALPPSAPITVPSAAGAAGASGAAYVALVIAYRWEANACRRPA